MNHTRSEASPPKRATQRQLPLLEIGAVGLQLTGIVLAVLRPPWLTIPLQATVENAGTAAPLVFVLLCALTAPLHLNSLLVTLSSLLWPLPIAGALSFTGSMIGCVLVAALLSGLGDAALQQRADGRAWLRRLVTQVARRPLRIGIIARIAIGSGVALEAFYLLAGYTRRQYLVVTTIGVAIWVTQALIGVTVLHALLQRSPWLAIVAILVPILPLVILFALRKSRQQRSR